MYTIKENLDLENLNKLKQLASIVEYSSTSTRLGVNNFDALSVYEFSKWNKWTRNQRLEFKSCLPQEEIESSVIGWFLNFPATTGFLDTMDYWKDTVSAGTITAYSLTPNNKIIIDNEEINVSEGKGIKFSLRNAHAVNTSQTESRWACLMLMI